MGLDGGGGSEVATRYVYECVSMFFFSSRRRHTRLQGDWSSDVCSSDLVTFDEASTVFGDPLSLLMHDPDHSAEEQRYLLLGMSNRRRLLVVAFAERQIGRASCRERV